MHICHVSCSASIGLPVNSQSSLSTTSEGLSTRQHHAASCESFFEAQTCVSSTKPLPWFYSLYPSARGAYCNFNQLAQSTTGKWISSIRHGTLFRMEIKDSCLRLLRRQVWHFKPSKCTLWISPGSSSNFGGDVTFNICSMAHLCEATVTDSQCIRSSQQWGRPSVFIFH